LCVRSAKYSFPLIFLVIFLISAIAHAQTATDSLLQKLEQSKGTKRADLLYQIARGLLKKDPVAAVKYTKELSELSNSLRYDAGKINALLLEGRAIYNEKKYNESIEIFKDAKRKAIEKGLNDQVVDAYSWEGAAYKNAFLCSQIEDLVKEFAPYEKFKKGLSTKADLLASLGRCYYTKGNMSGALEAYGASLENYKKAGEQGEIAGIGMNLGIMQYRNGLLNESLLTYEIALASAKKIKDTLLIADCITNIALSESALGRTDLYEKHLNEAGELYKRTNNDDRVCTNLMNKAYFLSDVGRHTEALAAIINGIRICEKNGEKNTLLKFYQNYSFLNQVMGDTVSAYKNINFALKIAIENNYRGDQAKCLVNLSSIYLHQGKYDNAMENLKNAEEIYLNLNNNFDLATVHISMGNCHLKMKQPEKAEEFYRKALEVFEKAGKKSAIAGMYSNIGVTYYDREQYEKALEYYQKATAIRKETKIGQELFESYQTLSNVYYKMNDFKNSYDYFASYVKLRDSLNANSSKKDMQQLQTMFETEKKEKAIEILSKDKELQSLLLVKNEKELMNQLLASKSKEQEIKLLSAENIISEAKVKQAQLAEAQKEKELLSTNKILELSEKEAARQKQVRNIIFGALVLVLFLAVFILRGYFQKRKDNRIISAQKHAVEEQNSLIQHQKKEITDSINYARRIQNAILPAHAEIGIKDYFILYQPKDIVSGDFYFYRRSGYSYMIAAVDCTGHGVPGAFMSLIGSQELFNVTDFVTEPGDVLASLNRSIKRTLRQHQEGATRDGMDVALIMVDGNKIHYSGANRPLYIVKKNGAELIEQKATKNAIGGLTANAQVFEQHLIELEKGDIVYLTTDGYADQFGGENGKKFTTKKFKQLLLSMKDMEMKAQEEHLRKIMLEWRKAQDQIDDVLVIGIRI
jgi:serine phosphatase RsbU (regulator of sigma subunit)